MTEALVELMTIAKNEHCEVRCVSGIILYAMHTVVSNNLWLLGIIPQRDCVVIAVCHCETALSRCGNLIFLIVYEIA